MSLLEPTRTEILPLSTKWKVIRSLFVLFAIGPWILLVLAKLATLGEATDFNPFPLFIFLLLTPWSFLLALLGAVLYRVEKASDSSKFWGAAIIFAAVPLCVGILLIMLGIAR